MLLSVSSVYAAGSCDRQVSGNLNVHVHVFKFDNILIYLKVPRDKIQFVFNSSGVMQNKIDSTSGGR